MHEKRPRSGGGSVRSGSGGLVPCGVLAEVSERVVLNAAVESVCVVCELCAHGGHI